jgi:hypothetical protein
MTARRRQPPYNNLSELDELPLCTARLRQTVWLSRDNTNGKHVALNVEPQRPHHGTSKFHLLLLFYIPQDEGQTIGLEHQSSSFSFT